MKIIKILTIMFCSIIVCNLIGFADIDEVNDLEKLESLYDKLKEASDESNSGRAMRDVILETKNLGIAVTYINDSGKLGRLSQKIRRIIIKNSANINSGGAHLFDLSSILPSKMIPEYKKTILRWFNGKK